MPRYETRLDEKLDQELRIAAQVECTDRAKIVKAGTRKEIRRLAVQNPDLRKALEQVREKEAA